MRDLDTTTKLVRQVLETVPSTRGSDNLLYLEVIKIVSRETGIDYMKLPLDKFWMKLASSEIPPIKTVERCRRRLQAKYPDLCANDTVTEFRSLEEQRYREYARG